jgi:hypothetical protein
MDVIRVIIRTVVSGSLRGHYQRPLIRTVVSGSL